MYNAHSVYKREKAGKKWETENLFSVKTTLLIKKKQKSTVMIDSKHMTQFLIDNLTSQYTCKCLCGLSRY